MSFPPQGGGGAGIGGRSSRALLYKGALDATDGTYPSGCKQGDYYIISHAGTISGTAYTVGDWAIFNGTTWDKIDAVDTVLSVDSKVGAVDLSESYLGLTAKASDSDKLDGQEATDFADINHVHVAEEVTVDTENFGGILNSSNDTIQKVLDVIDDLVVSIDSNDLGWYDDQIALQTAHPTASVGNYAMVRATGTTWVWDSSWINTGLDQRGIKAITPTTLNSVMVWGDNDGTFAKKAGYGAFVENGLFVKTPYGGNLNRYKFKVYANPYTTSYGGIVDISSYSDRGTVDVFTFEDTCIGFVANLIESVNTNKFGGGLLFPKDRLVLVVKPEGLTEPIESLKIMSDGVTRCLLGVDIPEGYTYNINGTEHNHDSKYVKLSGSTLTGTINTNGNKITNLPTPTSGGDAVNLSYVSGLVAGIIWRNPVDSIETTPPSSDGRYLVGSSGTTGSFIGHENSIATRSDDSWTYENAEDGWAILDLDTGKTFVCNSGSWSQMSGLTAHDSLVGLADDDHLQYVHTTISRIISAIHSFTNETMPFTVASSNLIEKLNADKLDGKHSTDFANSYHEHTLSTLTDFTITTPSQGQILAYDSGKFVNIDLNVGTFSLDPNHQFANTTERDDYFILHPSELVNGTFIVVGSGFQIYRIDTWSDITAVIKGATGEAGRDGIDGAKGEQGETGNQGPAGATGPEGVPGSPGTSIILKGEVATISALPEDATVNDAYTVTAEGGDLYIYTSSDTWANVGLIAGPRGIQGIQGERGYQGERGLTGEQGIQGIQGPIGPRGLPGEGPDTWQKQVENIFDEPPVNYDINDRFIVSDTPSGDWIGHANCVATWTESLTWLFEEPEKGWVAYNLTTDLIVRFNGIEWSEIGGTSVNDSKIKINSDDTIADYLESKIVPGTGIEIDVISSDGVKTLSISVESSIASGGDAELLAFF